MQVTLVCNEYPPARHAGIGTFVQGLARGLHQSGHRITVVGLGDTYHESDDEGIEVITLPGARVPWAGNLLSRLALRRWLSVRVRAGKVDIIETPDTTGLMPLGISGCPVVVRLHLTYSAVSLLVNHARPRGLFLYERHTLAANSNWIGVSQYVMQLTHSIFHLAPQRARIIYNFLPTTPPGQLEMPDLPSDFILYAGLVCHRKGAPLLAEAARDVLKRYPALHLVYVGGMFNHEGRPVSEIIQEILGPQLHNRVHFLGHLGRDATLACMKRAKLLAFPSKLESFGLVVIEAMSCGIPVVYTKDPPGPEIIDDGITGLLADPYSAEDFRAKIETLLDDPDLCSRLGRNAQRTVATRFSLAECVSSTENFYRECLSK